MRKVKVGIIGCGNISDVYMKNIIDMFKNIDIVGCADLVKSRAENKAEIYHIKAFTLEDILNNKEIEIIVNLTVPKAHSDISIKALKSGKHVYSEKPLGISRDEGKEILEIARSRGLYVGCAPDTFLGGGIQSCRKLIDDGWIGRPFGVVAFMIGGGPAEFHPNPDFFYKQGGGPLLDMGPYFITAMVNLLGPVRQVSAFTQIPSKEKTILSSGSRYGEKISVETPTYINGIMEFENGIGGSLLTSFDSQGLYSDSGLPFIQIFGTEGTLLVPDPNTFAGPVKLRRLDGSFKELPLTHGFVENSRGVGLSDMAASILRGQKNRASGDLAFHVLDIMCGFYDSAEKNTHIRIESTCDRPEPLDRILLKNTTENDFYNQGEDNGYT